jgi:hypothetical protein
MDSAILMMLASSILVIIMTETQTNQYRPATVTPPGATLADLIQDAGSSKLNSQLAWA